MSQRPDTYTKWAVIGAGEGGNRIAARMYANELSGIDERVVLVNTARRDVRQAVNRIREELPDDGERLEDQAAIFGPTQGVGNDFESGRQAAAEDFNQIVGGITDGAGPRAGTPADAFIHVTTLGGGTGNGSTPYVVEQLSSGNTGSDDTGWLDGAVNVSMGVWPYYDEPTQRHFNAICGLSRLLCKSDGTQNADMVLLGSNSYIASGGSDDGTRNEDDNRTVNEQLATAIDLMIGAGREVDGGVIDVEDYVRIPSQIGAYHFTPGVTTGQDGAITELEFMFDEAADNAFVPMDVETTRVAYAIVRVPRRLIGDREFTSTGVETAFKDWKRTKGIGGIQGMSTLTVKEGGRNEVDVLLLLGGFDLNELLDHSWEQFEQHKENLDAGRRLGNVTLSRQQMDQIETNLTDYLRLVEA